MQINGDWLNTEAIESISKPEVGCVLIQMSSGAVIPAHGVFSADALTRGILGKRFDAPVED